MAYIHNAGKLRRKEGLLYVDPRLHKKVTNAIATNNRKPIKTWSRRSCIHSDWVGFTFNVHNGKDFIAVLVTDDMIGHKLGEFALTRTFKAHSANNKAAVAKAESDAKEAAAKK